MNDKTKEIKAKIETQKQSLLKAKIEYKKISISPILMSTHQYIDGIIDKNEYKKEIKRILRRL